jgi:pyrroloquinoline quinone biosynthesis protein D
VTPTLAAHSSVRYNSARGEWLMMLPEAVVVLNETAASVLNLVDGERTVDEIVAALGVEYDGVETADVEELLHGLADQRLVVLT